MLDIKFIREQPAIVRENLQRRNNPDLLLMLDELIAKDEQARKLKGMLDSARARRNKISEEINMAKKFQKDIAKLVQEAKQLPEQIKLQETELQELEAHIRGILLELPNMLHDTVPEGKDETENAEVRTFGKKPTGTAKSHVDIVRELDLVELDRAAKISGNRWYFLKGGLALLEMALGRYALDFMAKRKFTPVIPPHMMNRKAYEGVTDLGAFEEMLYKIEGEDLFCIATSEHPLTAQFMDEVLDSLPITLAGYSTNFRKEAGAHGKDQKGIFRVHQFNKVEQIVVCKPEDSWDWHEKLLMNAQEFFESLGLHGRILNICSGDIGTVAAKKYDIDIWMPAQQAYREVVSCSNCTSYQAVRLNIRYQKATGERDYVHTLNSTLVATTRALVAILENFQQADGTIAVPKVLHKYGAPKLLKANAS